MLIVHLFTASITGCRPFPNFLKPGAAQLLVVDPGAMSVRNVVLCFHCDVIPTEMVLQTTLAIYMGKDDDNTQKDTCSLPTMDEVLVCNQYTTAEEVQYL